MKWKVSGSALVSITSTSIGRPTCSHAKALQWKYEEVDLATTKAGSAAEKVEVEVKHLKEARVPLVEFDMPTKKILDIQSQLEQLIGKNYYLHKVNIPELMMAMIC